MDGPIVLNLRNVADRRRFQALARGGKIRQRVDEFEEQLRELYTTRHPQSLTKPRVHSRFNRAKRSEREGVWVYFPWRGAMVHVLNPSHYEEVRLSRNKNLILSAEQRRFRNARIGVAGLNVGNPAALCLALEGCGSMKFADNDVLSLSNLNRFRAGLPDLGVNKAVLSAQQVYEVNPFAEIEVFPQGIDLANIGLFLLRPRINVLVEEMDQLPLKILIREKAREYRIPVVMVTGNGEDVILDVERFDKNPKLPLLNGHLRNSVFQAVMSGRLHKMKFREKIILARDFMGSQYLRKRLNDSFLLVGKKLAGIPQIAESSFLRGAVVAYAVRQIIVGGKMPSGRYYVKMSEIIK